MTKMVNAVFVASLLLMIAIRKVPSKATQDHWTEIFTVWASVAKCGTRFLTEEKLIWLPCVSPPLDDARLSVQKKGHESFSVQ